MFLPVFALGAHFARRDSSHRAFFREEVELSDRRYLQRPNMNRALRRQAMMARTICRLLHSMKHSLAYSHTYIRRSMNTMVRCERIATRNSISPIQPSPTRGGVQGDPQKLFIDQSAVFILSSSHREKSSKRRQVKDGSTLVYQRLQNLSPEES